MGKMNAKIGNAANRLPPFPSTREEISGRFQAAADVFPHEGKGVCFAAVRCAGGFVAHCAWGHVLQQALCRMRCFCLGANSPAIFATH
ncbi:MAG: hypothetical protein Q4A28_05875 [Brachymonas sp.]|nr:hypothetical protein [Brachymonas sp.]